MNERHEPMPDTPLTPAPEGQERTRTPEERGEESTLTKGRAPDQDSQEATAEREWQESEADNRGQSDN